MGLVTLYTHMTQAQSPNSNYKRVFLPHSSVGYVTRRPAAFKTSHESSCDCFVNTYLYQVLYFCHFPFSIIHIVSGAVFKMAVKSQIRINSHP